MAATRHVSIVAFATPGLGGLGLWEREPWGEKDLVFDWISGRRRGAPSLHPSVIIAGPPGTRNGEDDCLFFRSGERGTDAWFPGADGRREDFMGRVCAARARGTCVAALVYHRCIPGGHWAMCPAHEAGRRRSGRGDLLYRCRPIVRVSYISRTSVCTG